MAGTFRSRSLVAISLALSTVTASWAQSTPPAPAANRPAADRNARRNAAATRRAAAAVPTVDPKLNTPVPVPPPTRPVVDATRRPTADFAYVAPVTKLLFSERQVPEDKFSLTELELLVIAGDVDNAKKLLDTATGLGMPFGCGVLAAYSDTPTLEAAKALFRSNVPTDGPIDDGLIRGLVAGLARREDEARAAEIVKSAPARIQPELQLLLARYFPNPERLEAITKLDPRMFTGYMMQDCAIAFAKAGEPEKAKAALDEFDRVLRARRKTIDGALHQRIAVTREFLRLGDVKTAEQVLQATPNVLPQSLDELRPAFLVPWAVAGDTAAIQRAFDRDTDEMGFKAKSTGNTRDVGDMMQDLGTYSLAKAGAVGQAKKLASARVIPGSRYASYFPRADSVSFRLGLIAHAQAASGNRDAAEETLEEAVASIAKLGLHNSRRVAAQELLRTAVLGAETFAYDRELYDLWPELSSYDDEPGGLRR